MSLRRKLHMARRGELFERIVALPPGFQLDLAVATVLLLGFYFWALLFVRGRILRRRIGNEVWNGAPTLLRLFYIWPIMTTSERLLYVFAGVAVFGWIYILYSILKGAALHGG